MTHKIKFVKPLDNYIISVVFQNGVEKEYDMKKLFPVFPQLCAFETNPGLFEQVQVDAGGYGISWNDELDLEAEEIWEEGMETGNKQETGVVYLLGENLAKARDTVGMTQKQVAEETGIYQADISKIERGLANPSVSTLQRLAEGMGMKLKIEFVQEEQS